MLEFFRANNLFIRQASILAGGTLLAQIVNVLTLPILTRLYTPQDFGIFAVLSVFVAFASVFSTLKYENAIISVETFHEAEQGLYSILFISLVMSIFASFLLFVTAILVNISLYNVAFAFLIICISLISAWNLTIYYFCNRHSHYKFMTKGRVYGAIGLASISILFGFFFEGFWGLPIGLLAGLIINLIYYFSVIKEINIRNIYLLRGGYSNFLKSNSRFPKFLLMSSFLDQLSAQGHILLFAQIFGQATSGALSIYQKLAGLPSVLIGSALGDVFKRKASEQLRENGECRRIFLKTASLLFAIGVIPFLILLTLGPDVFKFLFGKQWEISGQFAQILSPVFLFGFIISPLSSLIYLEDNQKFDLGLQLFLLFSLVVTISIAIYFGGVFEAVFAYSFSYLLKYAAEISICWSIANGKYKKEH